MVLANAEQKLLYAVRSQDAGQLYLVVQGWDSASHLKALQSESGTFSVLTEVQAAPGLPALCWILQP